MDYEYYQQPLVKPEGRRFLMQMEDRDRQPAQSARHVVEKGKDLVLIYEVPGLGVIVMHAETDPNGTNGQMRFVGVSTFSNEEIHNGD